MAYRVATFTSVAIMAFSSATAATLAVSGNGNDLTGDGSAQTPYATVAKAMSMANEGDTVWAMNDLNDVGNQITFNKKNTTLVVDGATVAPTNSYTTLSADGISIVVTNGGFLVLKRINSTAQGLLAANQSLIVSGGHLVDFGTFAIRGNNARIVFHDATFNAPEYLTDSFGNDFEDTTAASTSANTVTNLLFEISGNSHICPRSLAINARNSVFRMTGGVFTSGSVNLQGGASDTVLEVLGGEFSTAVTIGCNDARYILNNAIHAKTTTLQINGSNAVVAMTNSVFTGTSNAGIVLSFSGSKASFSCDNCTITGGVKFARSAIGNLCVFENLVSPIPYCSSTPTMAGASNSVHYGRIKDGGTGDYYFSWDAQGQDNLIEFMPGASYKWHTNNTHGQPYGTNNVLRINDATLTFAANNTSRFRFGNNGSGFGTAVTTAFGGALEFRGYAPALLVSGGEYKSGVGNNAIAWQSGIDGAGSIDGTPRIRFVLPPRPYADAPIRVSTKGYESQPVAYIYGNTVFEIDLNGYRPPTGVSRIPLWRKTDTTYDNVSIDMDGIGRNAILPDKYNAALEWDQSAQTLFLRFKHNSGTTISIH